ncbi:ATP synthase F1, gamma subunit [Enterococcus sp. DIV0840]|uniref:F0F1 ATP synthase subunit gamma n=1 Tax=Enterococcus TaxID=1350 RepID=UPI001A8E609E|nr:MULTISPECIES: FoF1 ATP synthase subunit gamma [Enterococcus]MBO0434605.1 F0F1 ATP synthase subunit gamma [Enterococcus sp. DIV0849a]MBO0472177.1 F0F1 ATP synthase subunit gamma [Enterococcus ureasiticus]
MSGQTIEWKIQALESTYKVVRVTELATLGKLGKLRKRAEQAVDYYENILENLNYVRKMMYVSHETGNEKKIAVLVITSDRGLCGSYNSKIFAEIDKFLATIQADQQIDFYVIGEQGRNYLLRKKQQIKSYLKISLEDITLETAEKLALDFIDGIYQCEVDALHIIFTKYISAVSSDALTQKIYPEILEEETAEISADYILDYDESDEEIEKLLMTNYISGLLYSMFLYSIASENCIRRIVMKEAKDNIEKQLKEIIQEKKKADRQAQTNELMDIINGSTVIRKGE